MQTVFGFQIDYVVVPNCPTDREEIAERSGDGFSSSFKFLQALNNTWAMSLAVKMVGLDVRKEVSGLEMRK